MRARFGEVTCVTRSFPGRRPRRSSLGSLSSLSSAANAESVMRLCATQWKEAQGAGTTGGQTWPQFLAQCRAGQNGAAAAPAPAPAPAQSGSLIPWWQPSAPASAPASNAAAQLGSERHEAMREPMERRQGGGDDRRPDLAAVSGAMPSRAAQPRPRPRAVSLRRRRQPPAPCPSARLSVGLACFRGGIRGPRAGPERRRLLRPCERASIRPSFRLERPARQTRSCGSTRRRASTTIREPTITGTRAGAPICAKPTRRRADFARRGIANVRRKRLRAEGAAQWHRRALTEQLVSGHRLFPPAVSTASFDGGAALFTDEICPAERTRRVAIDASKLSATMCDEPHGASR